MIGVGLMKPLKNKHELSFETYSYIFLSKPDILRTQLQRLIFRAL